MPVSVRFLVHSYPYNIGEIAGFDPEHAERLVSRHIAELVTDTPAAVKDVPAVQTAGAGPVLDEEIEGDEEVVPRRRHKG